MVTPILILNVEIKLMIKIRSKIENSNNYPFLFQFKARKHLSFSQQRPINTMFCTKTNFDPLIAYRNMMQCVLSNGSLRQCTAMHTTMRTFTFNFVIDI